MVVLCGVGLCLPPLCACDDLPPLLIANRKRSSPTLHYHIHYTTATSYTLLLPRTAPTHYVLHVQLHAALALSPTPTTPLHTPALCHSAWYSGVCALVCRQGNTCTTYYYGVHTTTTTITTTTTTNNYHITAHEPQCSRTPV